MKFWGIIIKKGYGMLFTTLFLLSFSCILITANIYEKEQNEKISRGFYTENAQAIMVSEVEDKEFFTECFMTENYKKCYIYKTDFISDMDCRGIVFSERINVFPMQSGRCFTVAESRSKEKLAVVGGSILEQAKKKDGEQYITVGNQAFRIIGVVGKRTTSRLDSMIFIPMGAAIELGGLEGNYVIDGEEVENVSNSLFEEWAKSAKLSFNGTAFRQSESIGDVVDGGTNQTQFAIYLAVVFSFLLTVASCTIYWLRYRRQHIEAMGILGCSKRTVLWTMTLQYLKVAVPAVIISVCISVILWVQRIIIELRFVDCVFAAMITLFVGYFFVFENICFYKSEKAIKGSMNDILSNAVISIQFALFFWIFVQLVGYYVDLGNNSWIQTCKGDYTYLTMGLNDAESSFEKMCQIEEDPLYHTHVKKALKKIREQKKFSYMAYTKDWVLRLDMDTVEARFGTDNYNDFLSGSLYPGYYDTIQVLPKPEPQELSGINQIQLSFCSLDYNAMKHYNLKVQEGKLFDESDYCVSKDTREFPVLLGASYAPYFSVGDTIPIYIADSVCTGKVIGILEENTRIISDMTREETAYPTVLDYDIVLPFMNFESLPEDVNLKNFAIENDTRQLLGILVMHGEAGSFEKVEVQKIVNDIYREEGLFTVLASDTTQGVYLFQNETRQSMMILTTLTIVVLSFNLFSLCISLINKINRKMRRYGIQLMNGCTIGQIFRSYLLEIFFVTLIGFIIAVFLQRDIVLVHLKNVYVMGIIWSVLLMLSSSIIWKKLSKVDMEMLMRRKE